MPDSATALRLLRRWEIDEPAEAARPAPGLVRFTTSGEPVVLRRLPADVPRRELLSHHGAAAALEAAGLPVPAPIPARDGRTVIGSGGERYALYPWVEGRRRATLGLTLAQCHELGVLLGRFHAELARLLPPVQQTFLVPAPSAAEATARAEAMIAALSEPRDGHPQDELGERTVRQLRERCALLEEYAGHRPPEAEAVIAGHVHGSFDPDHLLYGRVGPVALLGWRRLRTAPLAGELVRAAARLFGQGDERGLDLDRVAAFVRGHATCVELDADQIRSAAHRLWWRTLCDVTDRSPGFLQWWTDALDTSLETFAAAYTTTPGADSHDEILEVS